MIAYPDGCEYVTSIELNPELPDNFIVFEATIIFIFEDRLEFRSYSIQSPTAT